MNIQITLNIDGSEVYRNYEGDIESIDWQKAVESMAGSIIEDNAVNKLSDGGKLNDVEEMALGY